VALKEVVIKAPVVQNSTGADAGHIKLNNVSARLIPGNNTNMIFNHLRLYPGIMAAGESTADLIIWGSYNGQNHTIFDGITLFNSYGISEGIGRVNPLLVKNMEVYKGGYNVYVGDRIGGVVLIDGKTGNVNEVDGVISLSTELANAYLTIPLFKGSSTLQLAGRKSYYQLMQLNSVIKKREGFYIIPTYDYGDGNLKFNSRFPNGDQLEISAMASGDTYTERLEREGNARYFRELEVSSIQVGTSAQYLHNWKQGGITKLQFAQSNYRTENRSAISIKFNDAMNGSDRDLNDEWTNPVREYAVHAKHKFAAAKKQDIEISASYIRNRYEFNSRSASSFNDLDESLDRLSSYILDDISIAKKFNLALGLKVDVPFSDFTPYFQPRITGGVHLSDHLKMNIGWGMYNQFVSQTPIIDLEGNRRVVWQTADGSMIPVLKSMHHVLGLAYQSDAVEINLEGYYKMTKGMSRFIENRDTEMGLFRTGNARTYGMDIYAKGRFKGHELWASYSLGWVEEKFGEITGYHVAPQSQRHEIKTALVLNFKPVHIAVTHVFGSGFPNTTIQGDGLVYMNYSRLDFAMEYGVDIRSTRLEAGMSLLNILNQENIRLNQFAAFSDGTMASTSGIPFTPSAYLNFGF
jgi:hypothetical protein